MEDNKIIIYNTDDGKVSVNLMAKDGTVWLNQQLMAELFDTSVPNISMHISNIFKDNELSLDSVIKDYLTTAADGKNYTVTFYSLDMILAVGFRIRSKRGVQFRMWANSVLKEFMQKGYVMDDERLKNPDGRPERLVTHKWKNSLMIFMKNSILNAKNTNLKKKTNRIWKN